MEKRRAIQNADERELDPMLLALIRALARELAESHIRDSRREADENTDARQGRTR